ncbi:MAG: aspartate/glutamate racemase family protein [Clostridiales Family XIII bacterium]|jgi:maleate isomerase|nr:aspartate/glutamate racemase family protein [Clostridiales Family XIII bacterium]
MYYGWRKTIGLLIPSTGNAPEVEFHRYAPEGVAVTSQHVLFECVDEKGLREMGARLEDAARILATGEPDIFLFACTMGSLVGGVGYDEGICGRLEKATGIPTITTSTAVRAALARLKPKQLAVVTPYSAEMNAIEKRFLEAHGFPVLSIEGLGAVDPRVMPKTTANAMYRLAGETLRGQGAGADALFVSCTGLGIIDYLPLFERDFGLPVIGSVQASLWHTLRVLGIKDRLPLGSIFEEE